MNDTTVFVDDAVTGHLPMICVRTGAPADGLHRISQRYGGVSGWAFLLIFLGPVGWIVLLAMSFSARSRDLTVRLPYSHAGLEQEGNEFRAAIVAFAATVLVGIGTAWLGAERSDSRVASVLFPMALVVLVVAVIATVALAARYSGRRPGIELDASGRWVTVRGVDRVFAAAVRDEQVARRTASS